MIIGITGSIGAGKTTVARFFENAGFAVQNSDVVVHTLYKNNPVIHTEFSKICPACVTKNGIDRAVLSDFIKANPTVKKAIENIVHPIVKAYRDAFVKQHTDCVLDIPLLLEKNIDSMCDIVIVVATKDDIRKQRVLKRGVSEKTFEMLNQLQMPQSEKIKKADKVFYTVGTLTELEQQVQHYINSIKG